MEDEVDVDIEGDEFDADNGEQDTGGLLNEHSAWRSNAGILPWELDTSISKENREAIHRMLLEEQYYLKGHAIPNHIWSSDANNKPKVKKSPAKNLSSSSSSSRWSKQEKELFEDGLAQFGRRWTKIAKLVGSRSVLQVKNYARQYLKHKIKLDPVVAAPSTGTTSASPPAQPSFTNTVRMERPDEDEDEDVDITDDTCGERESSPPPASSPDLLEEPVEEQSPDDEASTDFKQAENEVEDEALAPDRPEQNPEEEDEEEELKAPEQEVELDVEIISEDEKQAIPEFFEGRPSKTPQRYLKIRNYILDQWLKSKPKYLNKTSVRPGLKNCGDVNCIGRIHTYLELIGAINFNCEQAVYNRPQVADRTKQKEGKDVREAYQLAQRLQSMRTRKRRVRDTWGNWCDAKDLEGQTYEHLSAEELAMRRERNKACKVSRHKESFDPFQLIPCRCFGEEVQEPFRVIVCAETLLIMDMHAHVSRGEVIGLLGGTFNEVEKVLKICVAEPCNSVSTGLQCEMDPLSQTQACDMISSLGFSVVGWYHSHPSFHPNPSVRDINTQDQFQKYFSRGGAPFIGMIVSPYDPANPSHHSQTTCLLVKDSQESPTPQKLPYKFDFLPSQDIPDWDQTLRRALWIVHKYSQKSGSVHMERFFRRDSHLTCLEKMLSSLARYLEPLPDEEGEAFLNQIHAIFLSDFIAHQQQETENERQESNLLNNSPVHMKSGDVEDDTGGEPTHSNTVLHLGSVLSTGHDYLL
ncbi:histone H2A deubiquitinase MYSM1 [Corythoichthys intestinalis]|uniref:histone H2A deubiquitinase MYSM1 n=1 Tax=Corythoichthys intestinalis TaxID=161448 RepID=UPI0025A5316F|nr:histone H2A deubiquitinase MYSM1 [Corythoichthys intestinalis]XP_061790761.1 histone H2A deubiquitinase MYSM1 [Nerophis lumbriciformis]